MNDRVASGPHFKLFVAGMPIQGYPTPEALQSRLQMLYDPKDEFVLMKGPGHYMQCSGNPQTGFKVLYREGERDRYYRTAMPTTTLEQTVELFTGYLNQDERWRESVKWRVCSGEQGREDEADAKRRSFKLFDRKGDRIIINKKMCLIALGTLGCIGAAVSFFMLHDMMDLYLTWIPGSFLALGVIFLMLSSFVDD